MGISLFLIITYPQTIFHRQKTWYTEKDDALNSLSQNLTVLPIPLFVAARHLFLSLSPVVTFLPGAGRICPGRGKSSSGREPLARLQTLRFSRKASVCRKRAWTLRWARGREGCSDSPLPTSGFHPPRNATTATAASGRNREQLLGQRPARRKCRPRHDADAGCRNPLERGCSPLTILKKKSKHKKASAAPVGAIALTLFSLLHLKAPQSLRA